MPSVNSYKYLYCKYPDGTYSEASFNKDGNIYIINKVKVQRGMGHQKANEVLIIGIPHTQLQLWCIKTNCCIVVRNEPIDESLIHYERTNEDESNTKSS